MARWTYFVANGFALLISGTALGANIHVATGESIQKAIDAAPSGAIIRIDPGVYDEQITITKPITLQGEGWDKTILKPTSKNKPHTDAEKIAFADRLEGARTPREQWNLVMEYLNRQSPPTIQVRSTTDVTLRNLRIQGIGPSKTQSSGSQSLVEFDHTNAKIIDCGIIGPSNNGVDVIDGSDVTIQHTLVAAVWGDGVVVESGAPNVRQSKVNLSGCDIRNCYYAGVVLRGEGSVIDHCRISGAAWHGIRYDDCSPTITDNFIFGNARSGIYASGNTRAVIRNNIFWNNEMDAISCWFGNQDTIERNTIAHNLREGISVLGGAKPSLVRNVIVDNPVGVVCSAVANEGNAVGDPKFDGNWFWQNGNAMQISQKDEPAPAGSVKQDPEIDNTVAKFSLAPDSPARKAGAGSDEIAGASDRWPIQTEETAMIPSGDTRDYNQWKKPPAIR